MDSIDLLLSLTGEVFLTVVVVVMPYLVLRKLTGRQITLSEIARRATEIATAWMAWTLFIGVMFIGVFEYAERWSWRTAGFVVALGFACSAVVGIAFGTWPEPRSGEAPLSQKLDTRDIDTLGYAPPDTTRILRQSVRLAI